MGLGDDLMVSGEARRLKELNPSAKILVGDEGKEIWSPLYNNNPYISRQSDVKPGDHVLWVQGGVGKRPYLESGKPTQYRFHFVPYRAIPGNIFFTGAEEELAAAVTKSLSPFVVVEPHIKGTVSACNKDWGWENYQAVSNVLAKVTTVVQLGAAEGKSLEGVHRIVTPDFRTAAAVLARSRLYVGPEGGMHHAAAALGVPAVVIFGSYISPDITGYGTHTNLYTPIPGSPCGNRRPCSHCLKGMSRISVAMVVEGVVKQLCWSGPVAENLRNEAAGISWRKNRAVATAVFRERLRNGWSRFKKRLLCRAYLLPNRRSAEIQSGESFP